MLEDLCTISQLATERMTVEVWSSSDRYCICFRCREFEERDKSGIVISDATHSHPSTMVVPRITLPSCCASIGSSFADTEVAFGAWAVTLGKE